MAIVPSTPADRVDYIMEIMRRGQWNSAARRRCMELWGCSVAVLEEASSTASRAIRAIARSDGFVEGLTGGFLLESMGTEELELKDRLRAAELLLKFFPPKLEGTDEEYAAQCRAEFDRLSKDDDE